MLIQECIGDPNRERSMGVVGDPFWCWGWEAEVRKPVQKAAEVPRGEPEKEPWPEEEPGEDPRGRLREDSRLESE